jgi:hypothetical protein
MPRTNETSVGPNAVPRRHGLGLSARGWILAVVYIAVVAGLAASAFSDPHAGFTWREGAAMTMTLPVLVPALPVLYVGGAAVWNATGADNGGPMWPVTLVYTVIFAMIAVANVWLVAMVLRRRRRGSA